MKVLIAALLLLFCFRSVSVAGEVVARYFMQSPNDVVSTVPYGNNPVAGHFVVAGDAKIYYEVYGSGSPLLVLHGGGVGCTYEMGRFVDKLAGKYQVIAVSTRATGDRRSAVPASRTSREQTMLSSR